MCKIILAEYSAAETELYTSSHWFDSSIDAFNVGEKFSHNDQIGGRVGWVNEFSRHENIRFFEINRYNGLIL